MKFFKKLAVLSMALLCVFGVGALTACDGGDTSSSASTSEAGKTYTCYEFTVLDKDGNKVADGYKVFLCAASGSNCYENIEVKNGVCVYSSAQITAPGEYVAHVMNASFQEVELKEPVTTSADKFDAYTLQLAK